MMKPYAQGKRWSLYSGDVLGVLPYLRSEGLRIDALITDPPYSSGGAFRSDRSVDPRKKYLRQDSKQAEWLPTFSGDSRDQRSQTLWLSWVLSEGIALANPGAAICCFTDWRQIATTIDAIQVGGWVYRGLNPWVKKSARPSKGRFSASAEYVVWGSAGPFRSDGPCLAGYCFASPPSNRDHMTEKPADVMEWLVEICEPGGVILDPFAGSGSTGQAAIRSGRSVVLIEREPAYCDIIARRMEQAENDGQQLTLYKAAK